MAKKKTPAKKATKKTAKKKTAKKTTKKKAQTSRRRPVRVQEPDTLIEELIQVFAMLPDEEYEAALQEMEHRAGNALAALQEDMARENTVDEDEDDDADDDGEDRDESNE